LVHVHSLAAGSRCAQKRTPQGMRALWGSSCNATEFERDSDRPWLAGRGSSKPTMEGGEARSAKAPGPGTPSRSGVSRLGLAHGPERTAAQTPAVLLPFPSACPSLSCGGAGGVCGSRKAAVGSNQEKRVRCGGPPFGRPGSRHPSGASLVCDLPQPTVPCGRST